MAQKKLLTTGNAFQRTDKRWCGVVWYMDEKGERKRKSFSGTTKSEVNKKMKDYVADFDKMVIESDESKRTLEKSMGNWLRVFKFPALERGSYDRRRQFGRYSKTAQPLDERGLRLQHRQEGLQPPD